MYKHLKHVGALIYAVVCIFICTACATGTATHPPTAASVHTAMPKQITQPISSQQLLTNGPVTYVALGASDAVGVGSNQPGSQGYVPLLAERLPNGSHLINLGMSGIRLHAALSAELPLALSVSPNLITIWLVTNDFVAGVPYASYMNDLNTLLKQLRAETRARIVMANLPDLTLLPVFAHLNVSQKTGMRTEIQHWNGNIALIATHYNIDIVDLFAQQSELTAHPEYVSTDGFHPSPAGYVQLANHFWQAIKR